MFDLDVITYSVTNSINDTTTELSKEGVFSK
jgi:hypothetical protein